MYSMIERTGATRFRSEIEFPPRTDLDEMSKEELVHALMLTCNVKHKILGDLSKFEDENYNVLKEYWGFMDAVDYEKEQIDRIQTALREFNNRKPKNVYDDISDGGEI